MVDSELLRMACNGLEESRLQLGLKYGSLRKAWQQADLRSSQHLRGFDFESSAGRSSTPTTLERLASRSGAMAINGERCGST